MRQTPMAPMQDRHYLWPPGEPIVTAIAQKRAGLAMLKPTNAIRQKRVVAIFPPISGLNRGLRCDVPTQR